MLIDPEFLNVTLQDVVEKGSSTILSITVGGLTSTGSVVISGILDVASGLLRVEPSKNEVIVNGGIKLGYTEQPCDSSNEGLIRYNSTTKQYEMCSDGEWFTIKKIPKGMKIRIYNPNSYSLTDFQVKVDVSDIISKYGSNFALYTDTGIPVNYCFVQANGECNESYTGIDEIWIKVPSLYPQSYTYLLVYNSTNQAKHGDYVFDFYDDFNGDSLDTSKWGTIENSNYNLENGYIKMWGDYGTLGIFSSQTFKLSNGIIVEWRGRASATGVDIDLYVGFTPDKSAYEEGNGIHTIEDTHVSDQPYQQRYIRYKISDTVYDYPNSYLDTTNWFSARSTFTQTFTRFWDSVNGEFQVNKTVSWDVVYFSIGADTDDTSRFGYLDFVAIRKYAPQQPIAEIISE